MSPRSYNLGKRKASVEATRTRIIDAAIDAYAEFNVSGTSMQEVARRANVAPGTVFYHFATAEELAETAVDVLFERLDMPSAASISKIPDPGVRLNTMFQQMYAFIGRSERFLNLYFSHKSEIEAVQKTNAKFVSQLHELLFAALGDAANNRRAIQISGALVNPGFRSSLTMTGMSDEEAAATASELLRSWLTSQGKTK